MERRSLTFYHILPPLHSQPQQNLPQVVVQWVGLRLPWVALLGRTLRWIKNLKAASERRGWKMLWKTRWSNCITYKWIYIHTDFVSNIVSAKKEKLMQIEWNILYVRKWTQTQSFCFSTHLFVDHGCWFQSSCFSLSSWLVTNSLIIIHQGRSFPFTDDRKTTYLFQSYVTGWR